MKRIFSILLITAVLIGLMPVMGTIALAEEYATVTSTNGYGVRLREGPSKSYGSLGTFDVGTVAVVLQRGLEWWQIQIDEYVGWMQSKYLNEGGFVSGGTSTPSTGVADAVVTSGNGLRVWLRATDGGKRLKLYSPGTEVVVLERGNTWCRVQIGGSVGSMMTQFLDFDKEESLTASDLKIKSVSLNYPSPVVGDVLEAVIKPEDARVSYSWKVNGVELGTESTFTVLKRYTGATITLTVQGVEPYSGTATTNSYPVQFSPVVKDVAISGDGYPVVGDVLSAVLQPSSATVEYFWRVGGVDVSNEATYEVQDSDVGKLIQLKVSGIDGYTGSAAASANGVVTSNKEIISVELTDTMPVPGDKLKATIKPEGATVKYSWTVDGEQVSTKSSYTVKALDMGKQVKLTVSGTGDYSGSASVISDRVTTAQVTAVKLSNTKPFTFDTIKASVTPSNASVIYEWLADGAPIIGENGYSLTIDSGLDWLVGKKISVVVYGTGVYSGEAISDETDAVVNSNKLLSAKLNTSAPVVGDVIEVTLTPEDAEANKAGMSYVWSIDTETVVTTDAQYTVQDSDVGKQIRVRVAGTGDYTGEVYSGWTSAVATEGKVKSVTVWNTTTDKNASKARPEPGDVLEAIVDPIQADVTYKWSCDGDTLGTGPSIVVPNDKDYDDEQIKLTVTGQNKYSGTASVYTDEIVMNKPLTINFSLSAEAGKTPVYNLSDTAKDKQWTASIVWVKGIYDIVGAELDQYGLFKPNQDYYARITVKPASGYTMNGATLTLNGSAIVPERMQGNIVWYKLTTAATQEITDFYISGLENPSAGMIPTTFFSKPQYSGSVTWSPMDGSVLANADQYTATIQLTSADYDMPADKNVFHVEGASQTTYDPATGIITAVFDVKRELKITADKYQVYLDGLNARVVQCSADLTNYVGEITGIQWDIIEATVDATKITADGQLSIGMYEIADRELTVRATVIVDGTEYVGTTTIQLISGVDEDTAIKVEFIKVPNFITTGQTGYFEARVSNSKEGYKMIALWDDGRVETITNGYLTVDAAETCTRAVIKAMSVEDITVTASVIVDIIPPAIPGLSSLEELLAEGEEGIAGDGIADMLPEEGEGIAAFDPAAAEGTDGEYGIAYMLPAVGEGTPVYDPAAEAPAGEEIPAYDPAADAGIADMTPAAGEGDAASDPAAGEETPAADPAPSSDPTITISDASVDTDADADAEADVDADAAVDADAEADVDADDAAEGEGEYGIASMDLDEKDLIPAYDPEAADGSSIVITATVTGEVVDANPAVTESDADADAKDDADDIPEVLTITIADTVTGEIISETTVDSDDKADDAKADDAKADEPASDKKKDKDEELEVEIPDEMLDALEGNGIGESEANEANIKIRFTKSVSELKRGGKGEFAVSVEGSDLGVRWTVRRSKNADGKIVSTISQDGVLTVSKDETADKLAVVATLEDGSVYARWIVDISNAKTAEPKKETEKPADEAAVNPEGAKGTGESADAPAQDEQKPETDAFEGMTDEEILEHQMEMDALQEENAIVDLF